MSAHTGRPRFLRYFATGCLVVLAAAVITHGLEDSFIFRHLENLNLDTWLLAKKTDPSKDLFVVTITDDDYKDLFHSASPLNQELVLRIVRAIAMAGPRMIGVDLDTADWNPPLVALPANPPIVWARELSEDTSPVGLAKVLGGTGEGVCFGLPALLPDEDGVIRRYEPMIHGTGGPEEASFARRIVAGCGERAGHAKAVGEEPARLIHFIGDRQPFPHLSSSAILTLSAVPEWQESNPLKGKIVLLGGTFRAARDKFFTPVGHIDGVDILAHTVQSELPGGEVRRPGGAFFFVADLLLGMLLVAGVWLLPRAWALPAIFMGVPVLAFAASWAAFQSVGYFASFVPVLGGVAVHELIEHVLEYRHLLHEREHLIRERDQLLREREAVRANLSIEGKSTN